MPARRASIHYPQLRVSGNRSPKSDSNGQSELSLIRQLRSRAASFTGSGVRLGIGDDCALLRVRPGEELAVTTDLSIAGRHFRLDWHPPESVGHRTLARGLSDLAAMGARPVAAFLSLGLPRELTQRASPKDSSTWMSRFLDGLLALARRFNTPLAGGDLAESPFAVADIVLIGAVPRGRALLRSGARPGDVLYVTGALGGSAAALKKLAGRPAGSRRSSKPSNTAETEALLPHLFPQPRIPQGLWLQRHRVASSALDLSDGLSTDLTRLCQESGVAAEVESAQLPVYPTATLDQALNGGEDYELLFTAPPATRVPSKIAGVPVTRIGRILKRRSALQPLTLNGPRGSRPVKPEGWEHFS
jgi:thiamine-monophosphate kinase